MDPVIAQDGQAYERTAIEDWLERAKEGEAKSPMTNEFIGKTLVPAVQTRNAIERLISKGVIQGEAAVTWKAKHAELQAIDKESGRCWQGAQGRPGVHAHPSGLLPRRVPWVQAGHGKASEWFRKAAAT